MHTKSVFAIRVLSLLTAMWAGGGLGLAQAPAPASGSTPPQEEMSLIAVVQSAAPLCDKQAACRRLALIGTKQCVPALAALLADEQLCDAARSGLEPIGDPAVDEALCAALTQLTGRRLVGVVNSLGHRRSAGCVEALAKLLGGQDVEAASAAACALGRIGGAAAAATLQTRLGSAPPTLRPAVADACLALAEAQRQAGWLEEAAALLDRVAQADVPPHFAAAAVRSLILVRRDKGLPLLVHQLASDDKPRVRIALQLCRELPGAEVTQALVAQLDKLPAERQVLLIQALGDRRDALASAAVAEAATRGSAAVRVAAISLLPQIASPAAVPPLFCAAVDGNEEVAKAAAASLAGFPSTKEIDSAFLAMIGNEDLRIRRAAIGLAGTRRIGSATSALLKAAGGADQPTRAAALRALSETVDAKDLPALTAWLLAPRDARDLAAVESALSSACARLADKATCAGKLLACLGDAQGPSRCAVLRLLRVVGGAEALKAVRAAAREGTGEVQEAGVRALADWPTADAAADLLQIAQSSTNARHKVLCLRGCVRLMAVADAPVEQRLAMCRQAMDLAQRDEEKKLVLAGLGEVPHAEAAKMAEACLSTPAIRPEAEQAVLKIAQALSGFNRDEAAAILDRLSAATSDAAIKQQAQETRVRMDRLADFVTAWQVAGPFSQQGIDYLALLDVPFAPEKTETKQVAWQLLPVRGSADRAFMLDLAATLGGDEQRAAYVRTWVYCDKAQPVLLEFGTDDGSKLWLNGKVVHAVPAGGPATPSKYKVAAALNPGWNALLMKVTQCSGPWEFCFRVRQADGSRLPGLKFQPSAPR